MTTRSAQPRDSISTAIQQAAANGRPAVVAFMTAGFPDRAHFAATLRVIATEADVVEIGVNGAGALVLALVERLPYVREAGHENGIVRLYVDQGDVAVPDLIRVLDGAGLRAQSLTLTRPSLDDVFLRQTGRSLREEPAA